jgi:hypothetical protein
MRGKSMVKKTFKGLQLVNKGYELDVYSFIVLDIDDVSSASLVPSSHLANPADFGNASFVGLSNGDHFVVMDHPNAFMPD